jgi:hypothetical protein
MAEEHRDREMEALRLEMARLREELAALAAGRGGASGAASSAGSGAAAADEAGTDWSDVRQALEEARVRGEKTLKDVSSHIERYPVGSAVTAFGLGFLIARLLGGGRRS